MKVFNIKVLLQPYGEGEKFTEEYTEIFDETDSVETCVRMKYGFSHDILKIEFEEVEKIHISQTFLRKESKQLYLDIIKNLIDRL